MKSKVIVGCDLAFSNDVHVIAYFWGGVQVSKEQFDRAERQWILDHLGGDHLRTEVLALARLRNIIDETEYRRLLPIARQHRRLHRGK
jgi:hypothetical protein